MAEDLHEGQRFVDLGGGAVSKLLRGVQALRRAPPEVLTLLAQPVASPAEIVDETARYRGHPALSVPSRPSRRDHPRT